MYFVMKNIISQSHKYKDWGLLALRLTTGVVFIVHGWGKLTDSPGIEAFSGMVAKIGFPMPGLFAWLVALVEFVGGILLVAGVFLPYATILLAIVMLVALFTVKKFQLPAADPDLALLGSLIALFTLGPGKYAIGGSKHVHTEECKDGKCKVKEEPGMDHAHDHGDHDHKH